MGGHVVGILPGGAALDVEAGEAEKFLLEHGKLLGRQLAQEHLFGVAGIAGIDCPVLDVGHTLDEELLGDAQRPAEVQRVQPVDFTHHDHHVVGRLVVDHQASFTVIDGSAGRKLYFVEKSVAVGVLLIVVAHNLQREQTQDIAQDNRHGHTGYHKFAFLQIIVAHCFELLK